MKYNEPVQILDSTCIYGKVLDKIKPNSMVLEFGPSGGWMTKYMKEVLDCSVYIVEIDETGFKQAVQFATDGLFGDIEEYKWREKYANIQFDYILFTDVLEHLNDPERVLVACAEILKEEGSVLLSVPNIANSNVVFNLLKNRFVYTETGILDKSHRWFFTRDTIRQLISSASYLPVFEDAVYYSVGDSFRDFNNNYAFLPNSVARYIDNRENANVYQYIYEIKKKKYAEECSLDFESLLQHPKSEAAFFSNSEMYFDTGSGYNSRNMVSIPLDKFGFSQIFRTELKGDEIVRNIKWDISVGAACQCIIESLKSDGANVHISNTNADLQLDRKNYCFYHDRPVCFISGDFSKATYIEITFSLKPVSSEDIYKYFRSKVYKYEELKKSFSLVEAECKQKYKDLDVLREKILFNKNQLEQIENELTDCRRCLSECRENSIHVENELYEYKQNFTLVENELNEYKQNFTLIENELNAIKNSRRWKLVNLFRGKRK